MIKSGSENSSLIFNQRQKRNVICMELISYDERWIGVFTVRHKENIICKKLRSCNKI